MRWAKLRIPGSSDLLSAALAASISVRPVCAACCTKTAGSGTLLSASAASTELDTWASASNNRLLDTFMTPPRGSVAASDAREASLCETLLQHVTDKDPGDCRGKRGPEYGFHEA